MRRSHPTDKQTQVYFRITFYAINEDAKKILQSMLSNVRTEKPTLSDIFIDKNNPYKETSTVRWNMANIGSISTCLTKYDAASIEGVAEYNEPDIAVLRLVSTLGRVDPNLQACFSFEDEHDSFMGATFLEGAGEREHWWARLENMPDVDGQNKVSHFRTLREEFIRSRLESPKEQARGC